MSLNQFVIFLRDLIPFVSEMKETFQNWVMLNEHQQNHLKNLVEQDTSTEFIKPMLLALEEWDSLQRYGAPGVDLDFVACDNTSLQEVVKTSVFLNETILQLSKMDIKLNSTIMD
ncbi:uncharacterized protein LOC126840328 [Adelges cooleyi]|uniref:uncharacterized protein LOC126840328 n=1 Tax=Adelges cooleyi TaxID=133065 RepID=UPI00217FB497|nr:uncharacterized protein LOC126840328 [Adelges cooleyi]